MPTTTLFQKLTQIVKSVTTTTEHLSKPQPYHGNTPPNPSSLRLGYTNNLTRPAFDIPNTTFCGVPYRGKPPVGGVHFVANPLLVVSLAEPGQTACWWRPRLCRGKPPLVVSL